MKARGEAKIRLRDCEMYMVSKHIPSTVSLCAVQSPWRKLGPPYGSKTGPRTWLASWEVMPNYSLLCLWSWSSCLLYILLLSIITKLSPLKFPYREWTYTCDPHFLARNFPPSQFSYISSGKVEKVLHNFICKCTWPFSREIRIDKGWKQKKTIELLSASWVIPGECLKSPIPRTKFILPYQVIF